MGVIEAWDDVLGNLLCGFFEACLTNIEPKNDLVKSFEVYGSTPYRETEEIKREKFGEESLFGKRIFGAAEDEAFYLKGFEEGLRFSGMRRQGAAEDEKGFEIRGFKTGDFETGEVGREAFEKDGFETELSEERLYFHLSAAKNQNPKIWGIYSGEVPFDSEQKLRRYKKIGFDDLKIRDGERDRIIKSVYEKQDATVQDVKIEMIHSGETGGGVDMDKTLDMLTQRLCDIMAKSSDGIYW